MKTSVAGEGVSARPGTVLLALFGCLAIHVPAAAGDDRVARNLSAADKASDALQDNWLVAQVRHFRAYPHLDRAYRLLAANRFAAGAEELSAYLAVEPEDHDARAAYLGVLYRLRRYTTILQETGPLSPGVRPDERSVLFRGLAQAGLHQDQAALDALLPLLDRTAVPAAVAQAAAAAVLDIAMRRERYELALRALARLPEEDYFHGMQKGAALAGLQRYAAARIAYRKAVSAASSPQQVVQARETLFYLALKYNDVDTALQEAESIPAPGSTDPTWLRTLAQTYHRRHDDSKALAVMGRIPADSLTLDDRTFAADLRLGRGDFAEAIHDFADIARLGRETRLRFHAYMGLGYAYAGLQKIQLAGQAFETADELSRTEDSARALAYIKKVQSGETSARRREDRSVPAAAVRTVGYRLQEEETLPAPPAARTDVPPRREPLRQTRKTVRVQPVPAPAAVVVTSSATGTERDTLLGQAYRDVAAGDDRAAVIAFEAALAMAGADTAALYLDAGFAYARLNQPGKARDYFLKAFQLEPSPRHLLYIARSYLASDQPEMALRYFETADAARADLPEAERRAVLIELGNLCARQKQFASAATYFQRALADQADSATQISLAYVQFAAGQSSAAKENLLGMETAGLDDAQRERRHALLAQVFDQAGEPAPAIEQMLARAALQSSAAGYYEAALYADKHVLPEAALDAMQRAVKRDPANVTYIKELGYRYRKLDRLSEAAAVFEASAKLQNDDAQLFSDLGYTYKQLGENEKAITWFKRAIDAEYAKLDQPKQAPADSRVADVKPPEESTTPDPAFTKVAWRPGSANGPTDGSMTALEASPGTVDMLSDAAAGPSNTPIGADGAPAPEGEALPNEPDVPDRPPRETLQGLRREMRELTRRHQFNFYESYRRHAGSDAAAGAVPGIFNTGAIPSQGGVEYVYQPPGLGYQDGKIFQVFVRGLWSNRPDSLAIDSKSVQASAGARYKPFKAQDMFLSLERLIAVGNQAQDNWLARTSYAWADGLEQAAGGSSHNQTTVYADLGYFFPSVKTTAVYLEARQGRAFELDDRTTVLPHVVLAGRGQRPDPDHVSYAEVGLGAALKYRFNETRYEAERSVADLTLQYRHSLKQSHSSGWVLTAAVLF